MNGPASDEAQWLCAAAGRMGLQLSGEAAQALVRYLDLLQRWNSVYNLTAVRDRTAMRTQHLLDCLATIEPFRRVTEGWDTPLPRRILDVGSGGGLPGVILALLLPAWSVTCVDTVGKKAAFIQQVGGELGLSNLTAQHVRVEALDAPPFGAVAARAFSSLSRLVELAGKHLAPSGVYMAMKGKVPHDEIALLEATQAAATLFHVEQISNPDVQGERCIVWLRAGSLSRSA